MTKIMTLQGNQNFIPENKTKQANKENQPNKQNPKYLSPKNRLKTEIPWNSFHPQVRYLPLKKLKRALREKLIFSLLNKC